MYEDLIKFAIIWGPTLLFVLLLVIAFLVGLLRGFRKSLILLIHMGIALTICTIAYVWILSLEDFDGKIVGLANEILSMFGAGSIQSFLNVSPENTTLHQMLMELICGSMNEEELFYHIVVDNAQYIKTIVEMAYRIILFILLLVVYGILMTFMYLLYFFFYPVRRVAKRHNKKFENGEVSEPYHKRRLLGGIVNTIRRAIPLTISFSFLGALLFIATGANNPLPDREEEEISFGNETADMIYDYYSYVCEMSDTGIFKVLNNVKDFGDTPYYFYICDLVLQGKINDETLGIEDTFYFRDELGSYLGFCKDVVALIIEYGGEEISGLINSEGASEDSMELLMTVITKPGFAEDFSEIINDFEAKPFVRGICLSSLTSLVNNIDLVVEDEKIRGLVKRAFNSETGIKISELITLDDIKLLFNSVIELVVDYSEDVLDKNEQALSKKAQQSLDVKTIIIYAKALVNTVQELSLFTTRADKGNALISSIYSYCSEELLADQNINWPTVNPESWIDEFNVLLDAVDPLLDIAYEIYDEDSTALLDNLLYMFEGENAEKIEESYDKITEKLSSSQLLDVVFKAALPGATIDQMLKDMTGNESAEMPWDISLSSNTSEKGELEILLSAVKNLLKNDGADLYYAMTDGGEINSEKLNQIFELLGAEIDSETGETLLDSVLDSKIIHYVISSYVSYGNFGEFTLYVANDASETILEQRTETDENGFKTEVTKTFRIIKKDEIKYLADTILNCSDLFMSIMDNPEELNISEILTNEHILTALDESIFLQGVISQVIIDMAGEQETIILPVGYDNPENWINKNRTGEINYLVSAVTDFMEIEDSEGNPLIDSLLEGSVDINSILDLSDNIIDSLCSSKVLCYTISDMITNLGSEGFAIIIPAVSLEENDAPTTTEKLVDVVSANELKLIFKQIKNVVEFDDENNPTILYSNIFNKKGDILKSNTIQATLINFIIEMSKEEESFIAVPQDYISAFDLLKNSENISGNKWMGDISNVENSEMFKLLNAIESFIEKDDEGNVPSDFDLENDLTESLKISSDDLDIIFSSVVLNATVSKAIVTTLSTPYSVYADDRIVETELTNLFDCAFDLLGKTELTMDDFESLNIDTLEISKTTMIGMKKSKIIMSTLSGYISDMEDIYVPVSAVDNYDIVEIDGKTNVNCIKNDEFDHFVELLYGLFGTNDVIKIDNLDTNNIIIKESMVDDFSSSDIIAATISGFIADSEDVVVPAGGNVTTKVELVSGDIIDMISVSDDNNELKKLLNLLLDLFGNDVEGEKQLDVNNINTDDLVIDSSVKQKIVNSEILSATISKYLIDSTENGIVIPDSNLVVKDINVVGSENKQKVLLIDELNSLLDSALDLFGTEVNGEKELQINNFEVDNLIIDKNNMSTIITSKIINATVTEKFSEIESFALPLSAILETGNSVGGGKYGILEENEFESFMNILLDMLGGEIDASNLDAISITITKELDLNESAILWATMSKNIIDVNEITIPAETLVDNGIEMYSSELGSITMQVIEVGELNFLLHSFVEVLGEDGEFVIDVNDTSNINPDNIEITKTNLASEESILNSLILSATISDNIIDVNDIVVLKADAPATEVYDNVTNEIINEAVILNSQIKLLFDSIFAILGTDTITVNTITSELEDITISSAEEIDIILDSNIMYGTVSKSIIEMDTLTIIDSEEVVDRNIEAVSGQIDLITKTELRTFFTMAIELLGEISTNVNIDTNNLSFTNEQILRALDSSIFATSISNEVAAVNSVTITTDDVENVLVYNGGQTTIVKTSELRLLFNGLFQIMPLDSNGEISVNALSNTNFDELTITHEEINIALQSNIISSTVSNEIIKQNGNILIPQSVVNTDSIDYRTNSIIDLVDKDEITKIFDGLFELIGTVEIQISNLNSYMNDLEINSGKLDIALESETLFATISDKTMVDSLYIPNDSNTIINLSIYNETNQRGLINRTQLNNLFDGLFELIGSNISVNDLNTQEFGLIKETSIDVILNSSILASTISNVLIDLDALVKPNVVIENISFFDKTETANIILEQVELLFDSLFITSAEEVNGVKQINFNNFELTQLMLPTTESDATTMVESLMVAATFSKQIDVDGSSVIIVDNVRKAYTYLGNESTDKYIMQSELSRLILALSVGMGMSNANNLSFDSVAVPTSDEQKNAIASSEIIRATVTKTVMENDTVFIEQEAEGVGYEQYYYDEKAIIVLTEAELLRLMDGFTLLNINSFDNISLDIYTILGMSNKVDVLTMIAESYVYRVILSYHLSASAASYKVYQILSVPTSSSTIIVSGVSENYTYNSSPLGTGYIIKDPVMKTVYTAYNDLSINQQSLYCFTANDIIALQHVSV